MTTDKLLYEKLTYKVRGCIFNVYNQLGFGHKENVYSRALAIELSKNKISFAQEHPLDVIYDGQKVGVYRPDFIVDGKILLELKSVPFLSKASAIQLIYYLKGTNFKLGLLVNFGSSRLEIRRKIWSNPRKSVNNPR